MFRTQFTLIKKAKGILTPQTLSNRLKVWGFILILLPTLLVGLIFAVNSVKSEKIRHLQKIAKTTAVQKHIIEDWSKRNSEVIRNIASSVAFQSLDIGRMRRDIALAGMNDYLFDNVLYINKDGRVVINRNNDQCNSINGEWVRQIAGSTGAVHDISEGGGNAPMMVFSSPIFDHKGENNGVLIGLVNLTTLDNMMKQYDFGKTGEVYLVNEQGVRLTLPRNMTVTESLGSFQVIKNLKYKVDSYAVKNVLAGSDGIAFYKNHRGIDVAGAYMWIDDINCAIISEIEAKEIFEPIREQLINMMGGFLLVLVITFPLTQLMVKTIRDPIEQLIDASQHIQNKDYAYCIDNMAVISAPKEIKRLCATFSQMAVTINEHQKCLEEAIYKRTYELKEVNEQLLAEVEERKQAEITLQQSREKYRMLFNNANDAIFLISITKEGLFDRILEVNDIACQRLGYTKKDLFEISPIHFKTIFKDMADLKVEILNNQHILFESTILSKDGCVIPVEMNLQHFNLNGQSMLLGIARDLTERKQMEKEFLRLDRLNLIGEMAAGIGHEVRNPLTTVRGFLQMLQRKGTEGQNKAYIDIMIEELDRANSIISEYLSLAKNKVVNKKMCDLNVIVKTLSLLLEADGLIQNKYVKTCLGELPELMLDEKEVRQLILNLARNGLEAMSQGGCLTIKTYQSDENVTLAVEDEGSGIPAEVMEKLGTPFFTTKDQGTGLGLAVCYSIADRHNASITFDTGDGGTTFYVTFKTTLGTNVI